MISYENSIYFPFLAFLRYFIRYFVTWALQSLKEKSDMLDRPMGLQVELRGFPHFGLYIPKAFIVNKAEIDE